MNFLIKKYNKIFNKKKYFKIKSNEQEEKRQRYFLDFFQENISNIRNVIQSKKEINFLHSGQLGDIICSLPAIYSLSEKKCNLFLNIKKENKFLSFQLYKKLLPLLKYQPYIAKVETFKNQSIDINLDLFRNFPFLWYCSNKIFLQLTGQHFNLSKKFIFSKKINTFKKKIVIIRTLRRQNKSINYSFLKKYGDLVFLGLKDEFIELKKQINTLNYHKCSNFFEMCSIINSCKLFIGNASFGYHLAEGLKIERILEKSSDGPDVIPFGNSGYEFYFQEDFEKVCDTLLKKNKIH